MGAQSGPGLFQDCSGLRYVWRLGRILVNPGDCPSAFPKWLDLFHVDLIVPIPRGATSGGVIQYDYGETLHDGKSQHTEFLNKPPPVLLKAVSQMMESDYMTGKNPVSKIMIDALKEEIRRQFSRPKCDWLFQWTYYHKGKETNCLACDQNQLVDRPLRTTDKPYVHYGLIASGDQVMKDANTRDYIARDLDILCFEMEAAGLMDELSSLVIRGICDYCDSHKHRQWQEYASLTAAAYATALLSVVPISHRKKDLRGTRDQVWMVPFRKNPRFIGCDSEIKEIEGLIVQPHGPSKIAICGLGGVGKTQIALELAYCIRGKDSGYSIFLDPVYRL